MKKRLFTVGDKPISADELDKERGQLNRQNTLACWLWLPNLVWSVYAGVLGFRAIAFYLPEAEGVEAMARLALATFGGLWFCVLFVGIFEWLASYIQENLDKLKEIEPEQVEEALALTARYPELDKWRSAIVNERTIIQGEFKAMQDFNQAALQAESQVAIKAQQEAAFQKLHQH